MMLRGTCQACRQKYKVLKSLIVLTKELGEQRFFLCAECHLKRARHPGSIRALVKDCQDSRLDDVEQTDLFDVC